jgi:hypothetical protein
MRYVSVLMGLFVLAFVVPMVLVVSLSSPGLLAQDKPVVASAPEPQLTEVESLKLQLFTSNAQTIQSQMALLQSAMRELEQNREAFIVGIEKDHPGWLLNRQSVKWERAPTAPAAKK